MKRQHQPWVKGQTPIRYPHIGGCEGCRDSHLCNCCGAGTEKHERCTNGRCRRCHADTCTSNHGYGDPMKLHAPKPWPEGPL